VSKAARILGCACLLLIGIPYFGYSAYLVAVQDEAFLCGFNTFWGRGDECLKRLRTP
jgi:hypothetical protein